MSTVNGTSELLPLAPGDADLLRAALSKVRTAMGRKHSALDALLERLGSGVIRGREFLELRRLVERECTIRFLVIRQHAPGPDPDPNAPALAILEALHAKLGDSGASD